MSCRSFSHLNLYLSNYHFSFVMHFFISHSLFIKLSFLIHYFLFKNSYSDTNLVIHLFLATVLLFIVSISLFLLMGSIRKGSFGAILYVGEKKLWRSISTSQKHFHRCRKKWQSTPSSPLWGSYSPAFAQTRPRCSGRSFGQYSTPEHCAWLYNMLLVSN